MNNKGFADNELQEDSVIRKFRITASNGKIYQTQHDTPPASSISATTTRATPPL